MIQIDLDKIVPMDDLPNRLTQVVDDAKSGAIYVVTKDDRPAVAIVSIDQLEGLSGRKVVTPSMGDETPATPSPAPVAPPSPIAPATDLGTPVPLTTPGTPPAAPLTGTPPPTPATTPPAEPPKPPDEMAL